MESIFQRRSIRKYTDKAVTEEQLHTILKAGMSSPSSENNQEWVFVIVNDKEVRKKIMEKNAYAKALETAPLCIIVCADMEKVSEPKENFWIQDLSASCENMLIAARSLGLGSLWMGIYQEQRDQLRELLSLPSHVEALQMLTFGTAQEERPMNDRYLEDRVHFEQYGKKKS